MIGLGLRAANGPLEVLTLQVPRQPQSGELLLEVIAAGTGPWDALLHTGGWDDGGLLPREPWVSRYPVACSTSGRR